MTKRLLLYLPGAAIALGLLLFWTVVSVGYGMQRGRAQAAPYRWVSPCSGQINGQPLAQDGYRAECGVWLENDSILVRRVRR